MKARVKTEEIVAAAPRDRIIKCLATGFGLGLLPWAPGTYGTLLGIPLVLLLGRGGTAMYFFTAAAFTAFAVWVAGRAEILYGEADCQKIVIDEVAGYLFTMAFLPVTPLSLLAGFVVFRVMDSLKPWPINLIDRKCSGGFGVVADDIAAGVACNLILQVFQFR